MCTECSVSAADHSLLWPWVTPCSDDHPSFHFGFFLACFNWVPTPASLGSWEPQPDSNQCARDSLNGPLLLLLQALKNWVSLCFPSLPAWFFLAAHTQLLLQPPRGWDCRGRQTCTHTCWSEGLGTGHSCLCIPPASWESSEGLWRTETLLDRGPEPGETCSRKMCCRLMMDSIVTCMNCSL